ncbi:MAG: 23S rRNA (adenine(2503)-C(2))-methyltransferase RlmN [Acidimicrobiales bacterium]
MTESRRATSRYLVDRAHISELLADTPRYRVDQVWSGLYEQCLPLEGLTSLPRALRETLATTLPLALDEVIESISDDGETTKLLWRLADGALIETVLMHYRDRTTVCVSTQAGCAMACTFCATGQAGYQRSLDIGEIVEQVMRARHRSRLGANEHPNVVFMGMGEPFANYDNMWAAIERLHDDAGWSARNFTVSTVGIIPGIRRLSHERLPVNLAVSLHAANDELRNSLVPINRRYPIAALMEACRDYFAAKGRRVSFEWALIDGVNDRPRDAEEFAALARELRAHINLIPLNPTPGYEVRGSPMSRVFAFRDHLVELGANATVRRNRGTDIDAACGQLRAAAIDQPIAAPRRAGAKRLPS